MFGDCIFFFFNDTATTEIYTLSLHDALPISTTRSVQPSSISQAAGMMARAVTSTTVSAASSTESKIARRSEEHTSELQSRLHLVCRLLLEKKKTTKLICLLSRLSLCGYYLSA